MNKNMKITYVAYINIVEEKTKAANPTFVELATLCVSLATSCFVL